MNIFKLACCLPLLTMGMSHAAPVLCEGLKLTVNNKSAEELVVLNVTLTGAQLNPPGSLQVIPVKGKQIYTAINTSETGLMQGELTVGTSSALPKKQVTVKFTLESGATSCEYQLRERVQGGLALTDAKLPGGVEFYVNRP